MRCPRRRLPHSSVRNPPARSTSRASLILLVVVDDQDERVFRVCRSTTWRAWRRSRHGRILLLCRSGSCSPMTTTSSAKASGVWSRRGPISRSRRCAATSTRCAGRRRAARCGRHRHSHASGDSDEGIQAARACARRTRRSALSYSASMRIRRVLALLEGGSAGVRTS